MTSHHLVIAFLSGKTCSCDTLSKSLATRPTTHVLWTDWVWTTLICSPWPWWPVSEFWEAKYAAAACSLHLNCRDGADVTASAAALRHRARTGNPSSASEVQLILSEKNGCLMLQCPWEGTKVHTMVPYGKKMEKKKLHPSASLVEMSLSPNFPSQGLVYAQFSDPPSLSHGSVVFPTLMIFNALWCNQISEDQTQ